MASTPDRIAEDVWLVRGRGLARHMNVYLIEEEDGATVFDAGARSMADAIGAAARRFGGVKRVVLGHAHPDHRGAAPALGAPILCHPAEKAHAESTRGEDYFDLKKLDFPARRVMALLLKRWDGGPVSVTGTLDEGDEVATFRVVHLPGHAPGLIALWRERDRLALVSDLVYTVDPQTGIKGPPRMPHPAFNWDEDKARAAVLRLAELEPATVWTGHADPIGGNVRARLEEAAEQPVA